MEIGEKGFAPFHNEYAGRSSYLGQFLWFVSFLSAQEGIKEGRPGTSQSCEFTILHSDCLYSLQFEAKDTAAGNQVMQGQSVFAQNHNQ